MISRRSADDPTGAAGPPPSIPDGSGRLAGVTAPKEAEAFGSDMAEG
jgi:hypothetical protein